MNEKKNVIRHIYRHKLRGMVCINERKKLQQPTPPSMQFNFTGFNAIVLLKDGFITRDSINLHTGLEIITVVEGDPGEKTSLIIDSIITQLSGVISFSVMASPET